MHSYIPELRDQLERGKISRREFLRYSSLLGLSLAAAKAIAACAPATEEAMAPTSPAATVTSPAVPTDAPAPTATAVSGLPKRGGTMRVADSVFGLDHPARISGSQSDMLRNVLDYLTFTDKDNITTPKLAESWEASEDLKTWTFNLRQDITWSNGDPFNADDVVFTIKEWLDPEVGSSIAGLMDYLTPEGVEKVDDHTVRLHLDRPQLAVPEHLYHYPAVILNHRTFEGNYLDDRTSLGPFTLEEWIPEERVVLNRYDDYWMDGLDGESLPYLDQIVFLDLGSDRSAWVAAFKSDQIDYYDGPLPPEWQALKDDPTAQVLPLLSSQTRIVRMRADVEPWSDNRVRMALKLCQDRERILRLAYFDQGGIGQDCHVAPIHPTYMEVPTPKYDPERARALLEDAGFPNGLDVEMAVPSNREDIVSFAEVLKEDAEPAGLRITLNTMPDSSYWPIWTEVDLGITSWGHRPLPVMLFPLAYGCSDGEVAAWNETHWCDQEFQEILAQAQSTLDIEERKKLIGQLQVIQQERGTIGLSYWQNVWIITKKGWQGLQPHPSEYTHLETAWFDSGAT